MIPFEVRVSPFSELVIFPMMFAGMPLFSSESTISWEPLGSQVTIRAPEAISPHGSRSRAVHIAFVSGYMSI